MSAAAAKRLCLTLITANDPPRVSLSMYGPGPTRAEHMLGFTGPNDDDCQETRHATFDALDGSGLTIDSYTITGDEWRELDDETGPDEVWFWVRRGVDLRTAVACCISNEDPPGLNADYERSLDARDEEISRLASLVRRLVVAYKGAPDALRDEVSECLDKYRSITT